MISTSDDGSLELPLGLMTRNFSTESKVAAENSITFFGASLDALDVPEAVNIKRSYIEASLSGRPLPSDVRDPYAFFRTLTKDRLKEQGHRYLGRFVVESWLTPKPESSDLEMVTQESYNQFLRNDGFRIFAELLRDFVKVHVLPSIPGMVGVDHSLTGGVLMALSDYLGPENLGVLIFDVHTDAIPLPLRLGLAQYGAKAGQSSGEQMVIDETFDPYSAGSFLLYLMDKGLILPENLVIVGVRDNADRLRKLTDKRVKKYVRYYDSLCERGVKIIGKDQLQDDGPAAIQNLLNQLQCSKLYISLDIDVSAHCGVLATRFTDVPGTEISSILEVAHKVGELLASRRFSLVGLDIMEIDIHKLGAKLKDGIEDQTQTFIQNYTTLLCGNGARGGMRWQR
jgi:arginase family enzyme